MHHVTKLHGVAIARLDVKDILQGNTGISIHPNPTIQVSGKTTICTGESTTLTATGATSYIWQPGGSGGSIVVAPQFNTIYVVTGSTSVNCTGSKTFVLNVSPCSVIDELTQNGETRIFPNPTSGLLNIYAREVVHIKVYSETGSLIIEKKINPGISVLDISSTASGIYHAVIFYDQGIERFNLVKE